jgi:hypothetical protein
VQGLWVGIFLLATVCGCSGKAATAPDAVAKSPDSAAAAADAKTGAPKPADAKPRAIELTIDYGDGVEKRFDDIAWKEGMTVFDVLAAAQKHSHGISFSSKGSGATLMVTKIDDLANQGGATSDKNWVFRINGHLGDESCGVVVLRPGDAVLWKFGPYE